MKLIILTCNAHKWVVPIYNYFLQKYWPDNPYEIEVVTDMGFMNGNVFYAKSISWSGRLIEYVSQAKEDKFLITLDDYLIKSPVDMARVRAAELLCRDDVGYVRMSNCPYRYFCKHTIESSVTNDFREYPPKQRFAVVAHMAFYQRAFLLDVLKNGEDVWQFENKGTARLNKLKSKWRVLWPKEDVINYAGGGGLIKKGRLRHPVFKWAMSELSNKDGLARAFYVELQEKKNKMWGIK